MIDKFIKALSMFVSANTDNKKRIIHSFKIEKTPIPAIKQYIYTLYMIDGERVEELTDFSYTVNTAKEESESDAETNFMYHVLEWLNHGGLDIILG
jgi:hypothetical protein